MEIREKIEELEKQHEALKEAVKEAEEKQDNRPITERVKTFEDAVEILGEEHPFVSQWNTTLTDKYSPDLVAYLKLRIITAALNEGWEPQFTEDERRYFPWFVLYTQKEWDKLDEGIKKGGVLFGGFAYYGAAAGLVSVYSFYVPSDANATVGSYLCFKTDELARYAGRQFADLYADFYLIRK